MDIFSKLGFDLGSLLLYVINIGILLGALSYLLFPKILHFLDERRDLIAGSINEANQLKDVFQKKLEEIDREKVQTEKAMKTEIDALRVVIDAKREEMMKEIEAERSHMIEDARRQIEGQKDRMLQEAEGQMLKTITHIILHILKSKVPEEVISQSIQESWMDYKKNAA